VDIRATALLALAALGGLVWNRVTVAQVRVFHPDDVRRVASLDGEPQLTALREVLAGCRGLCGFDDTAFYYEARLRDPLRALLRDPKVGVIAGDSSR